MAESLKLSILSTVIYHDVLDYPLTTFEIWKYLIENEDANNFANEKANESEYSLMNIIKELENEELKKHVDEYQGFYFLKDRKKLVEERLERNKISGSKVKIIKKVIRWLRLAPYLRGILITGRVAMKNATWESDLDFLVILKNKRMFTGRFFITLFTHLLGRRRYLDKISNRVCLNYYITDKSLEISHKDLFSSHEYSFATPIFGESTFSSFQKTNLWIKKYRPNFEPEEIFSFTIKDNFFTKNIRRIFEKVLNLDFIENSFKNWQMRRIINDPRTHQKESGVMANDAALVFLPEPQGPKIYEKYKKKIEAMHLSRV